MSGWALVVEDRAAFVLDELLQDLDRACRKDVADLLDPGRTDEPEHGSRTFVLPPLQKGAWPGRLGQLVPQP